MNTFSPINSIKPVPLPWKSATGILSTAYIAPDELSPYGNVVSPGVLATNHQHIFSIRIDPAIDGDENSVVQEESVPMPLDAKTNPYGVGYTVEKSVIKQAGFRDLAIEKNRLFKIVNPNKLNPISKRNIGYKIIMPATQMLLAHPESVAAKRADFAGHHLWVTTHKDGELFAGGHFTNQSHGLSKGLRTWVAREDNVENTDIVVWCSIGLTHNPRVEDFPVMPSHHEKLLLVPADFFERNPAMDVPPSTQVFNQSVLVDNECCSSQNGHSNGHSNGHTNGTNGTNGHAH